MGKIQSKHGSYNAAKMDKKLSKETYSQSPVYLKQLPENQVYEDMRRNSMSGLPSDRPQIVLPKRPHTFIQSSESYDQAKADITKSWIETQGAIADSPTELDEEMYYSIQYENDTPSREGSTQQVEESRKISVLNREPTLAKLIEETKQDKRPFYLEFNNQKFLMDPTTPLEEKTNRIGEEEGEQANPEYANMNIAEENNQEVVEQPEQVNNINILEVTYSESRSKPGELEECSLTSMEEYTEDLPQPVKVEEFFQNEFWEPQRIHRSSESNSVKEIASYENVVIMNSRNDAEGSLEKSEEFVVHYQTHAISYDETSDSESIDSFKSCESDPENSLSYTLKSSYEFEVSDDNGLSTIEEESDVESHNKVKVYYYDNLELKKNPPYLLEEPYTKINGGDIEIFFDNTSAGVKFNQLLIMNSCYEFLAKEIGYCSDDHSRDHQTTQANSENHFVDLDKSKIVNIEEMHILQPNILTDELLEIVDNDVENKKIFENTSSGVEFNHFLILNSCNEFLVKEIEYCSDDHSNNKTIQTNIGNNFLEFDESRIDDIESTNILEPIVITNDILEWEVEIVGGGGFVECFNQNNFHQLDREEEDLNPPKYNEEQNNDDNYFELESNRLEYLRLLFEICTEFIEIERIYCSDDHDSKKGITDTMIGIQTKPYPEDGGRESYKGVDWSQSSIVDEQNGGIISKNYEYLEIEHERLEYLKLLFEICTDFIEIERTYCSDDHENKKGKDFEEKDSDYNTQQHQQNNTNPFEESSPRSDDAIPPPNDFSDSSLEGDSSETLNENNQLLKQITEIFVYREKNDCFKFDDFKKSSSPNNLEVEEIHPNSGRSSDGEDQQSEQSRKDFLFHESRQCFKVRRNDNNNENSPVIKIEVSPQSSMEKSVVIMKICEEFLERERNDCFKLVSSTKIDESWSTNKFYKKVYNDQGKLIEVEGTLVNGDFQFHTDNELDESSVYALNEHISVLRDDFQKVREIRQNVEDIRKKIEMNKSSANSSYLIELLHEMRKLNSIFGESFNADLLALQQRTLIEIQDCLLSVKSN